MSNGRESERVIRLLLERIITNSLSGLSLLLVALPTLLAIKWLFY